MSNIVYLPIPREQLEPKSLGNRFCGSEPKRNSFARAKNIVLSGELDIPALRSIVDEYDGDLCEEYAYEWKQLLEEIAYAIARDGRLEEYERAFILAYTDVFSIDKQIASACYKRGASRAYTEIVVESLGDGRDGLSEETMSTLKAIASHLGIKARAAKEELVEQLTQLVSERLSDLIEDGVISDEEWAQFESYRSKLRLGALYSDFDRMQIEAARARWRRMNGELEPIELSVECKLKAEEIPYVQEHASWYETRSNRGVQEYKLISKGQLIMTNQRVILLAQSGDNKTVSWSRLLNVTECGFDSFELHKSSGKSPRIEVRNDDMHTEGTSPAIARRLFNHHD